MEEKNVPSWSSIAGRLLADRMWLTALELHTELVESGREEPQLREFFSNPANFERAPSFQPLTRSSSQATLDSLDLTRFSEEGDKFNDVAVLEFELRKAKETINSLRANLTQATELDISSSTTNNNRSTKEEPIKPHEKRALNYLINEYLLQQDYKVSSITFSDENPDQDFEDWDDVGLNIPKQANLISIYRGDPVIIMKKNSDNDTQTDEAFIDVEKVEWINALNEEIALLKKQILVLETDKLNFQKLYDAALASLNSLSSPMSDMPSSETTLYTLQTQQTDVNISENTLQGNKDEEQELQPLPQTATQNYYGSSISTSSITPDQFEMIENDKNCGSSQKDGSNTSSFEPALVSDELGSNSPKVIKPLSERKESITTLEDTFSLNETEWQRNQFLTNIKLSQCNPDDMNRSEAWINSDIPAEYKVALMKFCNLPHVIENELFNDIVSPSEVISLQRLVYVVAATLPKIIPNLLLVKRDEAISLLVCTIFLHPEQTQREKLLQLLLNLKKKMEKDDRTIIISGLVLLVQWNLEINCGLDSDILGMCWEMLNSKSLEKRLLGAEASIAIAPYISLELVSSLLLSMIVSMCENNETTIRYQGLLGTLIACPTAVPSKYTFVENILFTLAKDTDQTISTMCIKILGPILARSSIINGIFHSHFSSRLINNLQEFKHDTNSNEIDITLQLLKTTITATLMYVVNVVCIKESINQNKENTIHDNRALDYLQINSICNPKFFLDDEEFDAFKLINAFYGIIKADFNRTWNEKEWFIDFVLKPLLTFSNEIGKSVEDSTINILLKVFELICIVFGKDFTRKIIRPMFEVEVSAIEQKLAKLQTNNVSFVTVSVYLGAVLSTLQDDNQNISAILKKWLICGGMCSLPCTTIGIPLVYYSLKNKTFFDIALGELSENVVHTSDQVRAFVAEVLEYLIENAALTDIAFNTRIIPGIVTFIGDKSILVKCKAINALSSVICLKQLTESISDKCWQIFDGLVKDERNSDVPRSRTMLSLIQSLHKILNNKININQEKVFHQLCTLCYSSAFAMENQATVNELLKEMIPIFQLITNTDLSDANIQNSLIPALRHLENANLQISSENKFALEAIIHKMTSTQREHYHSTATSPTSLPGILTNPESVGRRMTQMFQHSKPAMNLQNIFKKKT